MTEILKDMDAEKVCGGTLTEEAKQWLETNSYELSIRLGTIKNINTFNMLLTSMSESPMEYNVSEVKRMINEYCNIDVSDLV